MRELENILERALAFASGDTINVEDLGLRPLVSEATPNERADADAAQPPAAVPITQPSTWRELRVSEDGVPGSLPDYLDQIERDAIQRALERTRYNRTAAARLLGISFRALRYRMQRLDIH